MKCIFTRCLSYFCFLSSSVQPPQPEGPKSEEVYVDLHVKELQKGDSISLFLDLINTFSREIEAKPTATIVKGFEEFMLLWNLCLCI